MVCPQCGDPAVQNQANGKDFYYCRNCKVEVQLEEIDIPQHDDEYPFWDQADTDYSAFNTGFTVYANAPFMPIVFSPTRKHYYGTDKDMCAICGITAAEIANYGNEDCATRAARILKGIP